MASRDERAAAARLAVLRVRLPVHIREMPALGDQAARRHEEPAVAVIEPSEQYSPNFFLWWKPFRLA